MKKELYTTTLTENTAVFPYLGWEPENRDGRDKLPLLVFLHGAGERGDDPDKLLVHSVPMHFNKPAVLYSCVMIAPQCPAGDTWFQHLDTLHQFILHCINAYHCDPDAVSLTGISMGGFGTWELAMAYPDTFSAIAPVCGGGMSWRAPLISHLPARVYHGSADTVVPPERSIEMVEAVRRAGGTASLTIFHGVGHDSWVNAYAETDCIPWLLSARRKVRI